MESFQTICSLSETQIALIYITIATPLSYSHGASDVVLLVGP